jgi:DNA-binding MarR family transcriptional regulator
MSSEKTLRLGALLRLAHQQGIQELARWLAASAYADLQPAHSAAVAGLWLRPAGVRLTTLAEGARITKQSMGALVDHLMDGGYVERVEDPDDGRAALLRLTARGRRFAEAVRGFGSDLEERWAARVGAKRIRELRETLQALVDVGESAEG